MAYTFGKRSTEQIATMEADLQLVFKEALKCSDVDFGVVEGHRPVAIQQKYFKEGKSKIDGIKVKGKHNFKPSQAGDIIVVCANKNMSYDIRYLCFVAGVITATANRLFAEGKIKHKIRWGGNWDGDGEIITDQTFQDLVHFELL